MEKYSVSKLLGSTAGYVGYEEGGMLTNQLLRKPYSVILFDEVEKAAPEVLNILLQMLDDGRITAANGTLVDCSNCIVIMTSNLGAQFINLSEEGKVAPEVKEQVMGVVRSHFRPEFLNRISATVVFNRLSRAAISKICKLRLKEIEHRFETNGKSIKLNVDESAVYYLSQNGYSPDLGARPLNRLIQSTILNHLAVMILNGQVKDKEEVVITTDSNGIIVVPNHEVDDSMDLDVDGWTDDADEDHDKIVKLKLKEIEQRFETNGTSIKLSVDESAVHYLYQNGYSPDLGARPLNRLIQNTIWNPLVAMILNGQVKDEEEVVITTYDNGIAIFPNHEVDDSVVCDDADDSDDDLYFEI
ncbi:unnamed protein product [Ambrosiozyma monospora]|uniref:Unnamed protein product n=1 Tax=Ambrosiozyma monospora TaxID=43982 RepID=A0A9W6T1A2_AMBMO|nr:unnamed protein product [Ambrosiozyma monospora]